jgi:hypothetical protein
MIPNKYQEIKLEKNGVFYEKVKLLEMQWVKVLKTTLQKIDLPFTFPNRLD